MLKNLKSALILSILVFAGMPFAAAHAATCPTLSPGDLFTVPVASNAVYVVNSDNERLYFPNADVYHSWYTDYSNVVSLDPSCVSAYPAANNPAGVNYRPGSRLVKTPLDSAVYAIGPGNERMRIKDEHAARTLYGDNWASLIRDVHDLHWTNYADSSEVVDGSTIPDGMLVRSPDSSQIYYVVEGELTPVSISDSFLADDIHTIANTLINKFSKKSTIVDSSTVLEDPVQKQELSPFKTYRNVAHGFSFEYPRAWTLTDYSPTTNYWSDSLLLDINLANEQTDESVTITVENELGGYLRSFASSQEYLDYLISPSDPENQASYESLPEDVKDTFSEEAFNALVDTFTVLLESLFSGISTSYEETTVVNGTIPALDITTSFESDEWKGTSHMYTFWHNGLVYDITLSSLSDISNEHISAIKDLLDSFTFFTPNPTEEPPAPTAEDVRRISDLKQMQTALELYYTDNHHYPISTTELDLGRSVTCLDGITGFATTCENPAIMGAVPHDPAQDKAYIYTSTASGDLYEIKAILDGQYHSLSGEIVATPSGIRSVQES